MTDTRPAGAVTLGLISDTHLPLRLPALPATLPELFADVQLILHAGDVGELRVLDELGALGPVIAVHGNDDTPEAQRELPERALIHAGGHRVLLWHSHHAHRADELEFRKDDSWKPKLDRLAAHARSAGADMVVFGHTHIPLVTLHQGVWLINPGALAAGNSFTVQTVRSVARALLAPGRPPQVVHLDITAPGRALDVTPDGEAGFLAGARPYWRSIFPPELRSVAAGLLDAMQAHQPVLEPGFLRAAQRVWNGSQPHLTWEDVHREWASDPFVPAALLAEIGPRP